MKVFEWIASALVVIGVALMIFGSRVIDSRGGTWPFIVYALGIIALTTGVRLAIDVAKANR